MTDTGKQEKIKTIGIYLIIILALLRFLIYPLYGELEKQKRIIAQQRESYRLKVHILNQERNRNSVSPAVEKADLAPYLYQKTQSLTSIQLEVANRLSVLANEKKVEMARFEMLETIPGKTLSEAPITVLFSGQPEALMNTLKAVETMGKTLGVKNMEINKGPRDYVLSLTLSAYRLEK